MKKDLLTPDEYEVRSRERVDRVRAEFPDVLRSVSGYEFVSDAANAREHTHLALYGSMTITACCAVDDEDGIPIAVHGSSERSCSALDALRALRLEKPDAYRALVAIVERLSSQANAARQVQYGIVFVDALGLARAARPVTAEQVPEEWARFVLANSLRGRESTTADWQRHLLRVAWRACFECGAQLTEADERACAEHRR